MDALRSYEDSRARTAQHVAKQAGREGTNESRPWMAKLLPDALAAHLYTRWLRQASTFLESDPSSRSG